MSKNRQQILIILLAISLIFNAYYTIKNWNKPTYRLGALTEEIRIRTNDFSDSEPEHLLSLPKGLIVRDESPRGIPRIGQFDPERFSITITSNNPKLINYSSKSAKQKGRSLYPVQHPKGISSFSNTDQMSNTLGKQGPKHLPNP